MKPAKLTPHQQRTLHIVADAASRQGGTHVQRMRNGTICRAYRHGEFPFWTVRWRVIDARGEIIAEGQY